MADVLFLCVGAPIHPFVEPLSGGERSVLGNSAAARALPVDVVPQGRHGSVLCDTRHAGSAQCFDDRSLMAAVRTTPRPLAR